tara:strand:+ start:2427 stop:2774 length:348 start_codon:yes stop_codon:yes gene_type:complete
MKALIFKNKVVDLVDAEFPVSPEMTWMDAPEGCTTGWIFEDGAIVAPPSPSTEELMFDLREQRNRLLAQTDYLALADSTLTDEMRTYRQALRDLPANTSDPANVVWPTKPAEGAS